MPAGGPRERPNPRESATLTRWANHAWRSSNVAGPDGQHPGLSWWIEELGRFAADRVMGRHSSSSWIPARRDAAS